MQNYRQQNLRNTAKITISYLRPRRSREEYHPKKGEQQQRRKNRNEKKEETLFISYRRAFAQIFSVVHCYRSVSGYIGVYGYVQHHRVEAQTRLGHLTADNCSVSTHKVGGLMIYFDHYKKRKHRLHDDRFSVDSFILCCLK